MSNILPAFLDELIKTGAAKRILPTKGRLALSGGLAAAFSLPPIVQAYRSGRRGGQAARMLHAGVDPVTGRGMASQAAFRNHNVLFPRKGSKNKYSKNYKAKAFRR